MKYILPITVLIIFWWMSGCSKNEQRVLPAAKPVTGITLITPTRGPAGTAVTINGQGFITAEGDPVRVLFNGTPATVVSYSATQIVAYAPGGASSGSVTVVTKTDSIRGPAFHYGAAFSINSVSPSFGPPGTLVRVSGMGFGTVPGQVAVYFRQLQAGLVSVSDTALTFKVPQFAGVNPIRIVVNNLDSVTGPVFNYTRINSLSPATGRDGDIDTIRGTGFSPLLSQDSVTYNSKPAMVLGGDTGMLIVKVPSGSSGNNLVRVRIGGNSTLPTANELSNNVGVFRNITPMITALGFIQGSYGNYDTVYCSSAPAGAFLILNGYGFGAAPSTNQVMFNGVPAQVIIGVADSILYAKIPRGATTGPVSITVNGYTAVGPVVTVTSTGVVTFAGSPQNEVNGSFTDGVYVSQLSRPRSVTMDPQGNVYAIDGTSVYQFSPDGSAVSVFATNNLPPPTQWGLNDDFQFLRFDQQGHAYIATQSNILVVNSGQVSILAGDINYNTGLADGQGTAALFNQITGMAIDPAGNIWVTDATDSCIRKITPGGLVSTPYPRSFLKSYLPNGYGNAGLAIDQAGNLYYTSQSNLNDDAIVKITPGGQLSPLGWWNDNTATTPSTPQGLAADHNGNVYFTANNSLFEMIGGKPVVLAGTFGKNSQYFNGGYFDGTYDFARFTWNGGGSYGMVFDAANNLYVNQNQEIRKVILH